MRDHFTPLRLAVMGLIIAGLVGSFAGAPLLLLAALVAVIGLLLVGRSQGWRF